MNICLYGASSTEIDESYILATEALGEELGKRGHNLVYGGGANGLMGAAARGVVKGGGKVIGVAPSFFNVDGVLFPDCAEFIYTETMRQRKAIMEDRAEAFIAVPGGIGTFDELFEILSLKQLGRHTKPVAVFNINGYYNGFKALLENSVKERFMTETSGKMAHIFEDAKELLDHLENYNADELDLSVLRKVKMD